MTPVAKNLDGKSFFSLFIVLLISTDIAILLDIPALRQIMGFLFLTILYGLLIVQILKLNKIELTAKFVLAVGLSISFLMFFGLLINNLSLGLGYETPLSTGSLLIVFNIAFIVFTIIAYRTNKDKVFSLPNLNLTTSEKAFLVVPILFPALSIFGMHVMNTTDNNIILMFLLFLIPAYVAFICIFNQRFPKRLYPVVIFLISISLLLLISLRSNHIIGADTHTEFYYFRTTLDKLHWSITEHSVLNACLNISLLPTVYQSILNIPSEFLFRILYSLIYSISPLVIYLISKKYIGELYGFLASCFFMFQVTFLWTTAHSRTSIAILFFALAMMVLFNDKIDPLKKRILFIVFIASCMVSHYSTTYIFFFIMLGAFVGTELLSKKYTFKKVISLTSVFLFFALIFFWYSQVTEAAFNSGVGFIEDTLNNLNRFFIEESRTEGVKPLLGQKLEHPILSRINFVLTWSTFILIGIGVLTLIKRYREMIAISNVKVKKPDFLKTKFEMEYLAIVLMCAGLLVIMIALPFISIGYDIYRLYSLAIVILSVCFIIGGMTLSHFLSKERTCAKKETLFASKKRLRENISQQTFKKHFASKSVGSENGSQARAYLIILVILIPYFLFYSGMIHQLFGIPSSIILNSEGEVYDSLYIYDSESCGAKWLIENKGGKGGIYSDCYGNTRLTSQGKIPLKWTDVSALIENKTCKGYIYLRYYAVVKGKLLAHGRVSHNLSETHQFVEKSKIYANGGSEVYK